jgi:hypothetical protein
VEIVGSCSGGWNIIQLALQIIHLNGTATSTGVLGSVTTTNRYNSIKMVCIVANLEWVIASVSGNLTLA